MKKLILIIMLIFPQITLAETIQSIICNNFSNIDLNDEDMILEKAALLDDYKTYKTNGISVDKLKTIWKSPENYNIDIQDISAKSLPANMQGKFLKGLSELPHNSKVLILSKFIPNLINCPSKKIKIFAKNMKNKLLNEERNVFNERTQGKNIFDKSISIFTIANQKIKPSKNYIYRYWYSETQNTDIMLKIVQILDDSVLVRADIPHHLWKYYGLSADKNMLIKTTKKYVDEDILENGYYEYIGITSYTNILGTKRTVHTFKEIKNPFENLYLYDGQN